MTGSHDWEMTGHPQKLPANQFVLYMNTTLAVKCSEGDGSYWSFVNGGQG